MGAYKLGRFFEEGLLFWVFLPIFSFLLKQTTKQRAAWIVLMDTFVYFRRLKCSVAKRCGANLL
jgi:hypothetical protein